MVSLLSAFERGRFVDLRYLEDPNGEGIAQTGPLTKKKAEEEFWISKSEEYSHKRGIEIYQCFSGHYNGKLDVVTCHCDDPSMFQSVFQLDQADEKYKTSIPDGTPPGQEWRFDVHEASERCNQEERKPWYAQMKAKANNVLGWQN